MNTPEIDVIDTFAGPGGWSVATAALGLNELGIELDPWACATRAAAGHRTVRAGVESLSLRRMVGKIRGFIGSPPCGTFSAAGKGEGVDDLPLLHQALDDLAAGRDTRAQLAAACSDPRTPLVVEPLRYALELRPEWIALEQVPAVLPLWQHIARILRTLGYSVWTGVLNAADYGVPQTRKRAILIASHVRQVAPPEPTHAKVAEPASLFGPGRERWVSMAEALGWAGPLAARVVNTRGERTTPGGNEFSPLGPSWALTEKTRSWVLKHNDRTNATIRTLDEPAATLAFGHARTEYQWVVRTNSGNGYAHDYERDIDEPSPSVTSRSDRWKVDVGAGGFAAGYGRDIDEPSPTIRQQSQSWVLRSNTQENAAVRALDEPASTLFFGARGNDVSWVKSRPATTVCATDRIAKPGHRDREGGEAQFEDSVRISIQEAAILQSFPADYPWQGTKTAQFLQAGNAVPPLLALHVLAAATGINLAELADTERAA